jgi:nucleoside-diphosphate-sugar epimerase
MKVLITGGAGFLGLHLAHYFSKQKAEILLLDVASFAVHEYPKKCEMIIGDIRDKKLIDELTKRVDVVVHAAAALPLRPSEEIMDVNVNGTENLLKNSLKNKVKRFIYISSTAVYGVPERHPIIETDQMVGVGAYGQSKIDAENLCQKYRNKGLTVSILRPKTFLGPHRLGVFEILFDWIKDGKKIPVVGSGNNRYQLLDVEDLVSVVYLLSTFKNEKKINDVFNIGAEKFITIKKDMQGLFDYAKSGSKILPTPAWPIKKALWIFEKLKLSPLYQWVYDTMDKDSFVSIEKLTKTLSWHPKYSNSEALIKAYQWYLDNYEEIKSRPAGTTHTVGWKQGILGVFKRFL